MAMEQFVGNARHTNTLTGITEGLAAANQKYIVVGIAGNGSLIRRLKGNAQVLAEVHGKIGEVFHHYYIVAGGQLTNHLQFLFVQANPCRVIRVAIHNGTDVSLFKIALQLCFKLRTAVIINIECFELHAHHLQLHLLNGETGIDEEYGVFLRVSLTTGQKRCKSSLHAAAHGNASLGGNVNTDERLHETRGFFLQFGITLNVGIRMCYSVVQCLYLCLNAYLGCRKAGDAHLHFDEFYSRSRFRLGGDLLHLTDSGFGKICDAKLFDKVVDYLPVDGCLVFFLFHFLIISGVRLGSLADGKCLDVLLNDGFSLAGKHSLNGCFQLVVLDAKRLLGGAKQNNISRTRNVILFCHRLDIDHDNMVELLIVGLDGLHVGIVGDVHEGSARSDDPAVLIEEWKIAQRFHGFH